MNKAVVQQAAKVKLVETEAKDARIAKSRGGSGLGGKGRMESAQGGFLKKLYEDDDELDELRFMGGLDEDDEEVKDAVNTKADEGAKMLKRKAKALEKMAGVKKTITQKSEIQGARVGKLSLKKGSLALFSVCEVASDHLIVNHTRNTKGYVSLRGTTYNEKGTKHFKIGQLIAACVTAEVGTMATTNSKDGKSTSIDLKQGKRRKLQLSIEPELLGKGLSA